MLVLFNRRTTPDGRTIRTKGLVYTLAEHGIGSDRIDQDAVGVIQRLRQAGHQGYVVGGAVRDLLVGVTPKDFDIATDAHPNAVRKLFRSARVIGRRFKLVHVYFGREKYLEVATFRSGEAAAAAVSPPTVGGDPGGERGPRRRRPAADASIYGGMAEDAMRRDFTLNALFYDPIKEQIVDYVGGVRDVRSRRMRSIAKDDVSFPEDPVRIIRAIKHAALVGFRLPLGMRRAIRRHRALLAGCSDQRLTEELYKILRCGVSWKVLESSYRLGVLEIILPTLHRTLGDRRGALRDLEESLGRADRASRGGDGSRLDNGTLLAGLLRVCLSPGTPPREVMEALRAAARPLIPSNNDLSVAAMVIAGPASRGPRVHPPPGHPGTRHPGARAQGGAPRAANAPEQQGPRGGGRRRRRRRRRPTARP